MISVKGSFIPLQIYVLTQRLQMLGYPNTGSLTNVREYPNNPIPCIKEKR